MTADIDTNVLLYAVSNSAKEIEKKWRARNFLEKKNSDGQSYDQVKVINPLEKLCDQIPPLE